jgi:hypothetical protein
MVEIKKENRCLKTSETTQSKDKLIMEIRKSKDTYI